MLPAPYAAPPSLSQGRNSAQGQWTVLRCGWQDHGNPQDCGKSVTRELETVGEVLTGVQAVVTVGILHL